MPTLTILWTTSRLRIMLQILSKEVRIMLQLVVFIIGILFGGSFTAIVMALIFVHTDIYDQKEDSDEEEQLQESER